MKTVKKEHKEHKELKEEIDEQGQGADASSGDDGDKEVPAKNEDMKEKEESVNYDKYLRAVADLENYKKRSIREKADIIKYGKEEIIKDILPFVDSLDRALDHADSSDVQAFKEGIRLIQEQLLSCLKKHGVEKIDSIGLNFDPNFHEALMQVESEEHEENKVVNEVEKGYLLNGRLLRPSKVCICKKMNKENNVCE
ncbi:MAG: nucleotide exchange factor GrpE [Deltaproteobacteria bacterium]